MHKFSILIALLLTSCTYAQIFPPVEEFILSNKGFSGVILVQKDSQIIHAKAYGLAHVGFQIDNEMETKYALGSISKSFTAAAILRLQELGKLQESDRISKYLDSLPDNWRQITIKHLLSNSSGLPHTMSNNDFWKTSSYPKQPSEVLSFFLSDTLPFEPGQAYRYSGLGFFLLANIIEKVSGRTYQEFMRTELFERAGMKETFALNHEIPLLNLAYGYVEERGIKVSSRRIHPSNTLGAGNIYSTASDLLKWEKALFSHRIITEASLTKMLTAGHNNYGYGFFIVNDDHYSSISHGGAIPGMSTYFAKYPENESVLIVFSNFPNSNSLRFRDIVKGLKEIILQ